MSISSTCPQGHVWESATPGAPQVCPHCGAGPVNATTITLTPPLEEPPTQAGLQPDDVPTLAHSRTASGPRRPTVPGYEILAELGRGGMGVVYKARQVRANRLVALKMILSGDYAGAQDRERFRIEAEAVARLSHPGIVQIYEVGEHDGLSYFSLEYCGGGTLARKLKDTPQAPGEAARIAEQLARAMAVAHGAGIVHRDLKPGNVLLSSEGAPKIADFGLAKQLDSMNGQTQTGAILGTPSYMAPEQAAGQVRQVGPPADIWALGAILYEMLTGRPPFCGQTPMDTLIQVATEEPAPPSQLNPRVPRDLETIALKCLNKEARQRYASAEALADDLRRFQAGEPITARPIGRLERAGKWVRRNPVVSALMTLTVITLLAGTIASTYFAVIANQQAEQAGKAEQLANEKKTEAETAADALRWRAYVSALSLIQHEWQLGRLDRVRALLDAQVPPPDGKDLRGPEWYMWDRLLRKEDLSVGGLPGIAHQLALSPDGRTLAAASISVQPGGGVPYVQLLDARSGARKGEVNGNMLAAFSPDGRLLATVIDKNRPNPEIRVVDLSTGADKWILKGHGAQSLYAAAFSPDGSWLASTGGDHTVRLWDMKTGQEVATLRGHTMRGRSLAFHPSGRELVSVGDDGLLIIWDLVERRARRRWQAHDVKAWTDDKVTWCVAYRPDGKELATGAQDGLVKVWDPETGKEKFVLSGHTGDVCALAYAPDGGYLASAGTDQTVRFWNGPNGQPLGVLRGHSGPIKSVIFYPDELHIATFAEDQTVKVWDLSLIFEPQIWDRYGSFIRVLPSPNGQHLATLPNGFAPRRQVRLWDCQSGLELPTLPDPPANPLGVAWSRDGKLLASANAISLVVWDMKETPTVRFRQDLPKQTQAVGLAFSPDGQRIALCNYGKTISVRRTDDGQEILAINEDHVSEVVYHPREPWLAGATNPHQVNVVGGVGAPQPSRIALWDQAGKVIRHFDGHQGTIYTLAFDATGARLASGSGDRTVRIWDTASGQTLVVLQGHVKGVQDVAFSPDGSRLVSSSDPYHGWAGEIIMWDARTGDRLLTLDGFMPKFSPAGDYLYACGVDGLRVWDLRTPDPERKLLRQAQSALRFSLNKSWLPDELAPSLEKDRGLPPEVRRRALELGKRYRPDATHLRELSWETARQADRPPDDYRRALRQAELSNQLEPDRPETLTALGAVHYRLGDHAAAVAALKTAQKLPRLRQPDILPFLAMAQFRLGDPKHAATFQQLQKLMAEPARLRDAETRMLLHQAEEVIRGQKWRETPIRSWHCVGPFPGGPKHAGLERVDPPEPGPIDLKAEYAGKSGPVRWRRVHAEPDGYVDLFKAGGDFDSVSFAHVEVDSPVDQEAIVLLGTDNASRLWLNGQLVGQFPGIRKPTPDQEAQRVTLQAGRNTLLLKVSNDVGGTGFFFSMETPGELKVHVPE